MRANMPTMNRPFHERLIIRAALTLRPMQRAWWRVRRPTVMGASAMIVNPAGEMLLVRHTYMRGWHFPGGGVGKHESVLAAMHRELKEELGLTVMGEPELLGIYTNPADPRASHVAFYRVDSYEMDFKPNIEIAEWKFFAPDALPEGVGRGPRNRVAEMAGTRTPDGIW
jgi:8-oxo-dGTP pyrophosphatase MutT (NUDIX family)